MKANKGAALLMLTAGLAMADAPASNAATTELARNTLSPSMIELISARDTIAPPGAVERTIENTLGSVNERLSTALDRRHQVLIESMFPAQ